MAQRQREAAGENVSVIGAVVATSRRCGDERFSVDLLFDVARVLHQHGYEDRTSSHDLAILQRHLWAYLTEVDDG